MNEKVKHDKYGRVIIQDQDLLSQISGAVSSSLGVESDGACGDNAGCGDAECSNASC